MIDIRWEFEGFWALLADARFPQIYVTIVRKAHRQAWREWAEMHGRGNIGLRARFGRGAWNKFGFTHRSKQYERRQRKWNGAVMPYQSPDSPSRRRPMSLHMRGKMRTEGIGWRVQLRNGTDEVTSILKLPAARGLNAPQNAVYRKEFLALDRRPRESAWITERIAFLTQQEIDRRSQRYGRRLMRSAA